MSRKLSLSSLLYRAARTSRDVEVLTSGDPRRINRRIVNKAKGRILGRVGFWRRLWR